MKQKIIIALNIICLAAFAGCGNENKETDVSTSQVVETESSTIESTVEPSEAASLEIEATETANTEIEDAENSSDELSLVNLGVYSSLAEVAMYAAPFSEGETIGTQNLDHFLFLGIGYRLGEDVLTDELNSELGYSVGSMYKVDKDTFDEYFTKVLPVEDLNSVYGLFGEPWVIEREVGLFYNEEDDCIYCYMGNIGNSNSAFCISNESYKDGYRATFLLGLDWDTVFYRKADVYYVPADNCAGYEVRSIEIDDTIEVEATFY